MPIRPVRREPSEIQPQINPRPRRPPAEILPDDAKQPITQPDQGTSRQKRLKGGKPKRQPTGDYLVGNCRAPVSGQFKPGNPGGPGRPPKSRNQDTIIREQLDEKRPLTIDGKTKNLSQREILPMILMKSAMGGELRAIKILLDEAARLFPEPTAAADSDNSAAEDEAIVAAFMASLNLGEPADSDGEQQEWEPIESGDGDFWDKPEDLPDADDDEPESA